MSSSNRLDTTAVALLILLALVVLPLVGMGMGFGGMMGYGGMMRGYGTAGSWWPLAGVLVQVVLLVVLLGGGYVLLRRATGGRGARDPAVAELRMAYARGDLTDEEFEERRSRLEREES